MVDTVTVAGAFAAGVVSFASPCVLPLVPPYLAYMTGLGLDEIAAGDRVARRRLAVSAIAFVFGFATIFVALGASASLIGAVLMRWKAEIAVVAGIAIIVMGLHFLGVLRIGLLYREARFQGPATGTTPRAAGPLPAYAMGLAFGFGWSPCIGPILGTILAVAASSTTMAEGAGLLAVYSLGLGVPFLIVAAAAGPILGALRRFRRHMGAVQKVAGAALVVTGVMFLTGGIQWLSIWINEAFPVLSTIG
jgi:cytochrome c-type biogenesis protein